VHELPLQIGCAVFETIFYSLRSESKQIWILFACFGIFANTIYSHHSLKKKIRTNSNTNIRLDANKYMLKRYSLNRFEPSTRNKRIKPVLFAWKRINICFIFAYSIFARPSCKNRPSSWSIGHKLTTLSEEAWNNRHEKNLGCIAKENPWYKILMLM
jgi:hypothetical protein